MNSLLLTLIISSNADALMYHHYLHQHHQLGVIITIVATVFGCGQGMGWVAEADVRIEDNGRC